MFDPDEESSFSICSELANQIRFIDFENFKNRSGLNQLETVWEPDYETENC